MLALGTRCSEQLADHKKGTLSDRKVVDVGEHVVRVPELWCQCKGSRVF